MDAVTQQNAALVEEATAASRSMQDQATALTQLVAVFQLEAQQVDPAGARRGMRLVSAAARQAPQPARLTTAARRRA